MQQRKENRNKVRVTARHPRGRSQGQTAKRWMKTHKSVWCFTWVLVYTGYSQYKLTKTKDNPAPTNTVSTILHHGKKGKNFLACQESPQWENEGDSWRWSGQFWYKERVSLSLRLTEQNRWWGREFYSRVSFYLCWLFPAWVCECVSVCLYVDVSCAVCVTWMDS